MRGIDIYGISSSGSAIFVQVACLALEHCSEKLETLRQYRDGKRNALALVCDCEDAEYKDGVQIIPLRKVYAEFNSTPTGKLWFERAINVSEIKAR